MQRSILQYLFLILLFVQVPALFGQGAADTVRVTVGRGEQVRLNLQWTSQNHGDIQWQYSKENDEWNDIAGATIKYLRFTADSGGYYRAAVTSEECDPFYSAITGLQVLNISDPVADSITGTQAVIKCTAGIPDDAEEWGIMLDVKSVPDSSSMIITETPGRHTASFRVGSLEPGRDYYVRSYVKMADEQIALGGIIKFTTLKISIINRINLSDTFASVWYTLAGDTLNPTHGILYSENSMPDTLSDRVYGYRDDSRFRSDLQNLNPGSSYFLMPFIKVYGEYCFGEVVQVNTWTDYSGFVQDTSLFPVNHKIEWKPYATARKISQPGYYADYGRIRRVGDSDTLLLVYHGGPNNQDWLNVYLRKSYDNGDTWQDQTVVADISRYSNYWRFCNPELTELKNGWLILAYTANGKPETNENCYIHLLTSKDHGETWEGPLLIQTGRSWEPAMVQLPGGEIELFYSSEARWWPPIQGAYVQQEIHVIRSSDNGITWSFPQTVAWYPGKRDGMPVPLVLQGNRGIAFAIETVNTGTSPYIIDRNLDEPWMLTESDFESNEHRWLAGYFSGHGGAPYLIQLPTGETVLSVHIYRGGDWHQNNYMQVMIGDRDARNFGQLSTPWGVLPPNESAVNNSLFLKDSTTVMAVSCRNFPDGSGGIYWLEGTIIQVE